MARPTPPYPFVTIKDYFNTHVKTASVIGVVADALPACASRGTDWTLSATLVDRTAPNEQEGLKVRWFIPQNSIFEIKVGDVLMARQFNTSKPKFPGEPYVLLKTFTSNWTIRSVHNSRTTYVTYPKNSAPGTDEVAYANDLLEWWKSMQGDTVIVQNTTPLRTPGRNKKFDLVRNFQEGKFYDMIGDVVKIFPSGAQHCTLYVTDYTSNDLLYEFKPDEVSSSAEESAYNEEHRRGWTGPIGKWTLQITAWQNQSYEIRQRMDELVGSTVRLFNVRIRMNNDRTCLEGSLNDDKDYTSKVQFKKLTASNARDFPDLQDFLTRKRSFKAAQDEAIKIIEERVARKDEEEREYARNFKAVGNPRIKNSVHAETPFTTLSDISNSVSPDEGFHNRKYRVKVRVVDYTPNDIEQFAVKRVQKGDTPMATQFATQFASMEEDAEGDDIFALDSSNPHSDMMDIYEDHENAEKKEWTWKFGLLLEDEEKTRLPAEVTDSSATGALLYEAYEFAKDENLREVVKQKLDILWGNLAELKEKRRARIAEALSEAKQAGKKLKNAGIEAVQRQCLETESKELNNLYFDATIYEYGIKISGTVKRTFALTGIKIDD